MIILAPRQQFSEPAAENGPVWSYSTPILIVWPCASARGAHVLAAASTTASAASTIVRSDFIGDSPRKKVGCRVSRAGPTREDHPLASLASVRGAKWRERPLDGERARELPTHLVRRDHEGRS